MAYSMARRALPFMLAGVSLVYITACKKDDPSAPPPQTVTVIVPADHEPKSLDVLLGDVGIKQEQEYAIEAAAKAEQERIAQQKLEAAEKQAAPYLKAVQDIIAELGSDPKGDFLKFDIVTDRIDCMYTLNVGVVKSGEKALFPYSFEFDQDGKAWHSGKTPYSISDFTYSVASIVFREMPSHPKIEGIMVDADWSSEVPVNPAGQNAGQPITFMQWLTYFKANASYYNWREDKADQKRQKEQDALVEKTQPFAAPYLAEIEKIAAYGADAEGRTIKVTQVVDLHGDGYYIEVRRVDPKDVTWKEKQPAFYISFGLNGNQPYFETRPRELKDGHIDLRAFKPARPDVVPEYGIGNFQTDLAAWMVKAMYTNSRVQQKIADAKTRAR